MYIIYLFIHLFFLRLKGLEIIFGGGDSLSQLARAAFPVLPEFLQ